MLTIRTEHANDHPKTGYTPAITYGIKAPFETPDENF